MRLRRRLCVLLCLAWVAAAALGCTRDSDARSTAQTQSDQQQSAQADAQSAAQQQADQAADSDSADDARQDAAVAAEADAQQQSQRPAMRADDESSDQQQSEREKRYDDDQPAQTIDVPPRDALSGGFPLLPSAAGEGDEYGWSAALDGDILAVGAPYHDAVAEDAGAVFVFERRGDKWVEAAKLLPPFGEALGWFGRWLALDDGRLVVGAPYENLAPVEGGDLVIDAGAAYVYEQVDGEWRRTATLLPDPPVAGASFGWSVAIDGERLAVAAWAESAGAEQSGAVYVYRQSKGAWRLEARVAPPEPQEVQQFGRDIDLDGNVLAIGAPGHDDGETPDVGAVFVYHQYDFAWNFAGRYLAPGVEEGDGLATQVALSLPWLAAGAHGHDGDDWEAGAVYLWRLDNLWSFHSRISASDAAFGDWFGYAPALDGDRLVVGAPHRADPKTGQLRTGAAYVFELVGGEWEEAGILGPVNPMLAGERAEFGWVTDIHGDMVIVGSWLADAEAGKDAGAAAVYTIEE